MRSVWLALGALTTVIALMAGSTVVWEIFAHARPPTVQTNRTIPFNGKQLTVEARDNVGVSIVPGNAGEVQLNLRMRWSRTRPKVSEDWTGGKLTLSATCPGAEPADHETICEADYTVFVPTETTLDVAVASGELRVGDLYGDLAISSVSGNVVVTQTVGKLHVRSGSGDITANALRGEFTDVETGEGAIELSYQRRPMNVTAVVRTHGNIRVYVENGAYDVTVQSDKTDVDVVHDPSSPRKITTRTQDGQVDICCG
ncbi:DUF4097 family beta strand repeat-containing protein [Nonomuraea typhae]|uniref:DUF4097 family beta strand repeat-containing protein n=1 Tax=Nonomuraea typhae TaxID=2603600 RepID=UPI0012FA0E57|nr:DUF4097 family beta strand repeat-containing protein [Nonomuraea typhae]